MGVRSYFRERKLKKLKAEKEEIEKVMATLHEISKLQESARKGEIADKKRIKKDLMQNIQDVKALERLVALEKQIKKLEAKK